MIDDSRWTGDTGAFFDLALDMLCIARLDGTFAKVNPSFERVLGYTSNELLSRPFLELVHPDDVPATIQEMEKLSVGSDTIRFENRYRCNDGNWKWLAWTCPAPSDNGGLLYAVARDVTIEKEAEEQLRLRDAIFSSMQNGLLVTDAREPDHPIVYCNQAFCQLTGYAAEEVLGRNCRFLQGEDRSQTQLSIVRNAIREGRSCRALLRNYRKDGAMFWNQLVVSPVLNDQQTLTHFVGLQYDVSDVVSANQERWRHVSTHLESLAPRQRQVLDLLVEGGTTKSIARSLGISPKTVEVHRARILKKMSVDSVVDLVRLVVSSQP